MEAMPCQFDLIMKLLIDVINDDGINYLEENALLYNVTMPNIQEWLARLSEKAENPRLSSFQAYF